MDIVERLRSGFLIQLKQDGTSTWRLPEAVMLDAANEIEMMRIRLRECKKLVEIQQKAIQELLADEDGCVFRGEDAVTSYEQFNKGQ